MNKEGIYINASCIIRHHSAEKNGQPVYEARHADLQDFLRGLYDRFSGQYPKFHKMDLLSKLGWAATEILLQDMPMDIYAPEDTGVILANASSSLDTDEKYFETVHEIASPALFVYTLPNIVIGRSVSGTNSRARTLFCFGKIRHTFYNGLCGAIAGKRHSKSRDLRMGGTVPRRPRSGFLPVGINPARHGFAF